MGRYPKTFTLEKRFWSRVDKELGSDYKNLGRCWIWVGYTCKDGYGKLCASDIGEEMAHRVSWVLNRGSIPEGLWVLHRCDNPKCVNPDHLFLGTQDDNMKDMAAKGRSSKGEKSPNAKLTVDEVLEIRAICVNRTMSYPKIASMYGVCSDTILDIVHRLTWRHI